MSLVGREVPFHENTVSHGVCFGYSWSKSESCALLSNPASLQTGGPGFPHGAYQVTPLPETFERLLPSTSRAPLTKRMRADWLAGPCLLHFNPLPPTMVQPHGPSLRFSNHHFKALTALLFSLPGKTFPQPFKQLALLWVSSQVSPLQRNLCWLPNTVTPFLSPCSRGATYASASWSCARWLPSRKQS